METLTIGELAKRCGVNTETIRYYERRGLLTKPLRSTSGYRLFPSTSIHRVHFIKRTQALGFSLQEIADLLGLKITPEADCAQVWKKAEQKIADIDEKIRMLKSMKRKLIQISAACPTHGPVSDCPILENLDAESPVKL